MDEKLSKLLADIAASLVRCDCRECRLHGNAIAHLFVGEKNIPVDILAILNDYDAALWNGYLRSQQEMAPGYRHHANTELPQTWRYFCSIWPLE